MVDNFHEGFIFAFFTLQELFTKIKTAKPRKFCHPRAKRMKCVSIPDLLRTVYIAAKRSVSVSVPLTAITVAIQEIEMLCKHRCTNQTVVQSRERKLQMSWVQGYFPRRTGTKNCGSQIH